MQQHPGEGHLQMTMKKCDLRKDAVAKTQNRQVDRDRKNPITPPSENEHDAPVYRPTDNEIAVVRRMADRMKTARPAAHYKIEESPEGRPTLRADHCEPAMNAALLHDTFATASTELATGLRDQLMQVSRTGSDLKAEELNRILAVVRGISPRDETEALLACQMAAIHNATMVAARRLNHVENIPQQDSASNMLNKLARTFVLQVDALKRHRSTGIQTIQVQHVTVNDGGQAIVGDVTHNRGGVPDETQPQPLEPEPAGRDQVANSPPVLGHVEADTSALQSTGRQRLDSVPVPRSTRRRSKR
jgi:hypothetical protein